MRVHPIKKNCALTEPARSSSGGESDAQNGRRRYGEKCQRRARRQVMEHRESVSVPCCACTRCSQVKLAIVRRAWELTDNEPAQHRERTVRHVARSCDGTNVEMAVTVASHAMAIRGWVRGREPRETLGAGTGGRTDWSRQERKRDQARNRRDAFFRKSLRLSHHRHHRPVCAARR